MDKNRMSRCTGRLQQNGQKSLESNITCEQAQEQILKSKLFEKDCASTYKGNTMMDR